MRSIKMSAPRPVRTRAAPDRPARAGLERRGATVTHWVVATTGLVGIFAFWGGVVMAARRYPSEYDWRYMTVSSLLATDRNPAGHLWSSAGIVSCGILGFLWATLSMQQSRLLGAAERPRGFRAFQLGYICTAIAAALPDRLVPLPKAHEILAILAFTGLCYGVVGTFQNGILRRIRRSSRGGRFWGPVLACAVVSPVVLAAVSLAYVFLARPDLPWVNLSWRARGVSLLLSFAFWEWVTCGVLSAYMAVLVFPRRTVFAESEGR